MPGQPWPSKCDCIQEPAFARASVDVAPYWPLLVTTFETWRRQSISVLILTSRNQQDYTCARTAIVVSFTVVAKQPLREPHPPRQHSPERHAEHRRPCPAEHLRDRPLLCRQLGIPRIPATAGPLRAQTARLAGP